MRGPSSLAIAALCVALPLVLPASARAEDSGACERAAAAAEAAHGVPAGLLRAVGVVESGRFDPESDRVAPWPWTANVAGAGRRWQSQAEAAAAVGAALASGAAQVDAGCFQVNLQSHPGAFASVTDAFDPQINADYAASFLASLHDRLGSWAMAAGAYHSATEALAEPYRRAVLSAWAGRPAGVEPRGAAADLRGRPLAGSDGMRVWGPSGEAPQAEAGSHVIRIGLGLSRTAPRVIRPSRHEA